MLRATEAGAVILSPMPGFYHLPKTIDDILDQFGIYLDLIRRWDGLAADGEPS